MGGVTIPSVVARIFSGDSTSPLTRGGKNVVRSEGGLAIPPVVARIFSGDSTSPLTREASVMVWGKGWCGDLSVDDALHCNRKNRVLSRTRLILTVDILFRRYPLAVLLYCKVKMRCQLRLAFDSPCNAYLLT